MAAENLVTLFTCSESDIIHTGNAKEHTALKVLEGCSEAKLKKYISGMVPELRQH